MNWNNLTISQWQRIQTAVTLTDDMILQWLSILPILTGKDRDVYKKMPLSEFNHEVSKYNFLAEAPTEIVQSVVEIKGRRFTYNMDIKAVTADQFITLSELTKDQNKIADNLHFIMAVFFIEKGKDFNGEAYKENAELFKEHMTMDIAYPLQLFFCTLLTSCLPHVNRSLSQAANRNRGSRSIGAGIASLTRWRRRMSPGGNKS